MTDEWLSRFHFDHFLQIISLFARQRPFLAALGLASNAQRPPRRSRIIVAASQMKGEEKAKKSACTGQLFRRAGTDLLLRLCFALISAVSFSSILPAASRCVFGNVI